MRSAEWPAWRARRHFFLSSLAMRRASDGADLSSRPRLLEVVVADACRLLLADGVRQETREGTRIRGGGVAA
jgi:hypothetical protein